MTDDCQSSSKEPLEASNSSAASLKTVKEDKNDNKNETLKENSRVKEFFHSHCSDSSICVTLENVLKSFNNAISEEQAWAILYQTLKIYRDFLNQTGFTRNRFRNLMVPIEANSINLHKDGTVHFNFRNGGKFLMVFPLCLSKV